MTTRRTAPAPAAARRPWHLVLPLALWLAAALTLAGDAQPLKPLDRSSPRAALAAFLETGDALGEFLARDYLPAPSRAGYQRLVSRSEAMFQSLDLSELPPAARAKSGRSAALALYEALSRIPLPPAEQIPATLPIEAGAGKAPARWVVPNTEIALVRTASGEFLFSAGTVARSEEFYAKISGLPYVRPVPVER